MSERSHLIARLSESRDSRASYIRAKVNVLVPAQLHALRLKIQKTQKELAGISGMKQSRISAMEQPGAVNFNLETLVRMAATFKVGLKVEFVSFAEMLRWENEFNQDNFNVAPIKRDLDFLKPEDASLRISKPLAAQFVASGTDPLKFQNQGRPPVPAALLQGGGQPRPSLLCVKQGAETHGISRNSAS